MAKDNGAEERAEAKANWIEKERYSNTKLPNETIVEWRDRNSHQDNMILMHNMALLHEKTGGPVYEQATARYRYYKDLYDKGIHKNQETDK